VVGFYDQANPEHNFRQQVQVTPYSSFVNVSGLPALALPVTRNQEGLPVGVQLIGSPGGDATILRLGAQLEEAMSLRALPAPAGF
jgi:amidase